MVLILGNCALFVDTLNSAFDIEVKGFKQRSVDKPNNEIVIKGPHEAFVENIRTNTSLIRRIVNNENLIIENIEVGKITKTKCAVCYLKNVTNSDLVNEVKYRLNNLEIDSLLSAGELEQLLVDSNALGVPQTISTERPDKAAKYLLKGRVIVIVNGTPYGVIMPSILVDFLTSPEDTNLKVNFANFLRSLRFLAAFITLLLPGLYVAITSFHQEILPTGLLYSILASRENVPFPIILEILLMEISFELIREAGLRVPSAIGPTIGIVGALVLGQAAVSAGIVSPILIIVVAITGISSFAIPDFSFGFHLRYFRFGFVLLGFMAGFLGISLGLFVYISLICSLRSFGVSYTTPFAPAQSSNGNGYLLSPIWKREYRPSFIASKRENDQEKYSMKWKYHKKG
ncbi:MAG: spore germination protein [Clostridia bacterium]|nr:spore germination protein [Clostridia bacterium]